MGYFSFVKGNKYLSLRRALCLTTPSYIACTPFIPRLRHFCVGSMKKEISRLRMLANTHTHTHTAIVPLDGGWLHESHHFARNRKQWMTSSFVTLFQSGNSFVTFTTTQSRQFENALFPRSVSNRLCVHVQKCIHGFLKRIDCVNSVPFQ